MKKTKTRLTAILMAICCVFAFLGFGLSVWSQNQTAKAEDVPTVTTVSEVWNASASGFYAATRGYVDVAGSWDDAIFVLSAGTGNGAELDGNALNSFSMKKIDVYWLEGEGTVGLRWCIGLGTEAEQGSELYIDGTYHLSTDETKALIFDNVGLKYDGAQWAPITKYTDYNLGKMTIATASMDGNLGTRPDHLYLKRADGNALPFTAWENPFVLESGDGLKVNGDPVTIGEVQSAPEGFWLSFASADRGDIVTLSGSFVCSKQNLRYTIEESTFIWNGVVWADYDPNKVYAEFNVGALRFHGGYDGHPTFFDFALTSGEQFPLPEGAKYANADAAWACAYAVWSGLGITLNDETIMPTVKFPNQMFIEFANAPVLGDVLIIEGTFYCDSVNVLVPDTDPTAEEGSTKGATVAIKYTIARSEFVWNGSAYVDLFAYTKSQKAAEIDEYFATFSEEDYNAEEWEAMEEIVANAKIAIDLAIDAEELATVVEDAKAELDEVQTKEEIAAIIGEKIDEAKAELDAYANQADYKDAEWAEIQALIAAAKAEIDKATSPIAINNLVAEAKADIDEVKTAAEVDAEALATAKTNAKNEINAYYGALNFEEYSDEANATLTQYVTEAKAAVDAATSVADVESIVATFKADVDAVEKTQPSTKPSKGGCGASVASGMVTLVPVLALAVCMIIRKKREI